MSYEDGTLGFSLIWKTGGDVECRFSDGKMYLSFLRST